MTTRPAFPISLDSAAIGVSTLCIIHCLALPLLVVALPALAVVAEVEWVHKALVLVAAPVSLFALTRLQSVEGRWLISALIVIYENPGIRHGELADMLLIKLAQMSKMIKSFEAKGWVERRRPREDKRAVELFLTSAGRDYVEKNRPILMHHEAGRPSGLTAREHQQLVRLLRKYLCMKTKEVPIRKKAG